MNLIINYFPNKIFDAILNVRTQLTYPPPPHTPNSPHPPTQPFTHLPYLFQIKSPGIHTAENSCKQWSVSNHQMKLNST